MRKLGGKAGALTKVPAPGATPSAGRSAPKLPKPQGMNKNTRDYGKALPQQPQGPAPSPFGYDGSLP